MVMSSASRRCGAAAEISEEAAFAAGTERRAAELGRGLEVRRGRVLPRPSHQSAPPSSVPAPEVTITRQGCVLHHDGERCAS